MAGKNDPNGSNVCWIKLWTCSKLCDVQAEQHEHWLHVWPNATEANNKKPERIDLSCSLIGSGFTNSINSTHITILKQTLQEVLHAFWEIRWGIQIYNSWVAFTVERVRCLKTHMAQRCNLGASGSGSQWRMRQERLETIPCTGNGLHKPQFFGVYHWA